MELEIRETIDGDQKSRLDHQLQGFRAEWQRLRADYRAARDRGGRTARLSSSDDYHEGAKATQTLLDNTDTLERGSRKLERGHQLLVESETVGASILNDLSLQRDVLVRSRNRLRDTDDDLGTSSRILSGMILRIQQSKMVLAVIAVAIVGAILIGVYLSFEA